MAQPMAPTRAPLSATRRPMPIAGKGGLSNHQPLFTRQRWRLVIPVLLLGHLTAQAQTAPIRFRYDLEPNSIGKLSEITDDSGVTRYSHDKFGRLATKRQSLANGLVQQVGYGYNDKNGLLVRMTYPGGEVLGYGYDNTGRLIQLDWNGTPLVSNITWNPMGQPLGWTWAFTSTGLSARRVYDTAARLTATEFSSYVYDAAGRITSLTQNLYQPGDGDPTHGSIASATRSWNVGYDATGRITAFDAAAPANDRTSFRYDPNGNRLSSERTLDGQTTTRSYSVESGSNRITGFSQARAGVTTRVSFSYNANGDMTGDGLKTYTYDAQRRLSAVTTGAGDASPTTRYAHNALGQRVFKTEPLFPPAEGDGGNAGFMQRLVGFFTQLWGPATHDAEKQGFAYIYNEEGSLLAETGTGGANSAGSTQYIYLPTASGPMPIAAVINGSLHAVHSDHLNTPRRLTDSRGQVAWQWAYSAFGEDEPTTAKNRFANVELTPIPGTSGIADVVYNIGFMGMYRDKESGLAQNWNRYFDKRTGRYTQPDRIGLSGGPNRYSYANLNPLRYADPDGRLAFMLPAVPTVGGWIAGAAGATAGAVLGWDVLGPMLQRDKTPNTGEPGSWHTNPGNGEPGSGQERLFGPDGNPEADIDWHPDHGVGKPHGHNWENGRRGPGVPLSPWPRDRNINGCFKS